jgi:ketosteroid isomerase-like protein
MVEPAAQARDAAAHEHDATAQAHDAAAGADRALRHWISGAADGDWSQLIGMLAPDVVFSVPVEGFYGNRSGRSDASRFFAHLTDAVRAELTPTSALVQSDRVAFEVSVRGRWLERPFRQALCLVFVVRDGRIIEFREYLAWPGGLDPE